MTDVRVMSANPSDAPAIRRIARDAWHAAYDEFLGPETVEAVIADWYALDGLRENIADEAHVFVRADVSGTVRGFAHAGRDGADGGWALFRIYVAPETWGEGIGTDLLGAVEDALRARGASAYHLGVLAENDVGVAFYESRGFERVETTTVELAGVETLEYTYRTAL